MSRPHYSRSSSDTFRACVKLLQAAGASDIRHRHTRRHIRLIAIYRGVPISTIMACTPSDWRAHRNAIARLRRQLRAADHHP